MLSSQQTSDKRFKIKIIINILLTYSLQKRNEVDENNCSQTNLGNKLDNVHQTHQAEGNHRSSDEGIDRGFGTQVIDQT